MKTYKMLFVVMVAAAQFANAQTEEIGNGDTGYFSETRTIRQTNIQAAEKGYVACLKSDNEGVVESALVHAAMLKLVFPMIEFKALQRQVEAVATNNPSLEVRYKAYLVSTAFQNPGLFVEEIKSHFDSPDELLGALASRMQQLVAANSQQ